MKAGQALSKTVRYRTIIKRTAVLLAVVFAGSYLFSRVASPWRAVRLRAGSVTAEPKRPREDSVLRIGTYNIAHGRGPVESNFQGGDNVARQQRLEQIAELLKQADLDLVVLNEVDFSSVWSGHVNQAEIIAERAGYPYWIEQRNLDVAVPFCRLQFGNAVLSRFPIRDSRLVDLSAYSRWESLLAGKKQAVLCTVEHAPGQFVRLLGVHLEHRDEGTRVAAIPVIEGVRRESELPLICAGDFNSEPIGFPNGETDGAGRSAMSELFSGGLFAGGPVQPPQAAGYTFSTMAPSRVIDWILVPPAWRIKDQQVLDVKLSDHRPLWISVEIKP